MSLVDRALVRVGGVKAEVRAPIRGEVVRNAPGGALSTQTYYGGKQQPQAEQFSAQNGIDAAYLAEQYVYRCVDTIANTLAGLAFRAGYDLNKPGSHNTASPLAKLLGPAPGSPNNMWSAASLWRYMAAQYVITGKTALAKGYDDNGKLASLWPLSVQYLQPIPGPTSGEDYFSGFQYGTVGNPMFKTYQPDDIVYLWRPSVKDFRQPESVIQAAQLNISVLKMIESYDYVFLKNNAVPSTLVITEPFVEPEQRRAFRDQFVAEFTGYANAGKTLFMERGFDDDTDGGVGKVDDTVSVQRLGLTQSEAQQSETRDAKIRDVCVAMGVPLSVLGDSSLSKFQNYDTDLRTFWLGTMTNLMRELQDGINTFLAPELGREVGWFDVSNIPALQKPRTFKPEEMATLIAMRVITRDEGRQDMGYAPYAEVDPENLPVITPYNTTTPAGVTIITAGTDAAGVALDVGKLAEQDAAKPEPPVIVPPALPAPDAKPALLAAARARRAARSTDVEPARELEVRSAEARHAGHEGHDSVVSGHLTHENAKTPDHVRKAFEAMLTTGLTSLFAEQQRATQDRLNGRRGRRLAAGASSDLAQLFDAAYWEARTVAVLEPICSGLAELDVRFAQFGHVAPSLGKEITAETVSQLGLQLVGSRPTNELSAGVDEVFAGATQRAFDQAKSLLSPAATGTVARSDVEAALLQIHTNQTTAAAAITDLQLGATG